MCSKRPKLTYNLTNTLQLLGYFVTQTAYTGAPSLDSAGGLPFPDPLPTPSRNHASADEKTCPSTLSYSPMNYWLDKALEQEDKNKVIRRSILDGVIVLRSPVGEVGNIVPTSSVHSSVCVAGSSSSLSA